MASMISGDFVEAYVLKNACKEKMRRAEANAVVDDGEAAAQGKKQQASDEAPEKKAPEEAGSKGDGGGLFGLVKKKVHPKVEGTGPSS
ncbi:uncharacterized protein LOC133888621 [Phragmites australis]|uniref:uncharacterized protein LOC133888621 n=1 Tax=Phragmites australis TaxID=29695 RepID=UPI002D76C6D7|nr:uncharacterized protein LOC133888621 [Phragmites australis]